MMETPRRSSTHLPQSQHPAGRSGVNYANLISSTHPSSALCVCALRFVTDPGGSSNAITSPWTGKPQDCSPIAAQQSQNEGEDNEPVRCASDILEHAQKTRVGTDRQKKIQNGASEEERERSNLHALLWLIKGTSQEEHSEGLCHYLRWGDEAHACLEWI